MPWTPTGRYSPGVRAALFQPPTGPATATQSCRIAEVKPAILGHAEFTAFKEDVTRALRPMARGQHAAPDGFDKDDHPKTLIETIAEDLLDRFRRRRCSMPTTSTST